MEPHLARRAEAPHRGRGVEELAQPLRIADAGRRLGVVLGEVQGVGQQKRVEARRRAGGRIPGLDVDERVLGFGHAELVVDVVGLEGRADDALAEERDRLGRHPDARFVSGAEKERPQERAMDTLAEGQLLRAHRRGERGREPRRQLLVRPEQRVPVADEIHGRVRRESGKAGSASKAGGRADPEHLFPPRPALRGMAVQRAIDDEVRHLLDDVREIERRDAIAFEVRRRD